MNARSLAIAGLLTSSSLVSCAKDDEGATPIKRSDGGTSPEAAAPRACNGHAELCDRPFDEVAFPATHNAHSAREYGYPVNANQINGFAKQLDDGVRAMLMDVYTEGDAGTVFCHGFCTLAKTPHLAGLVQIRTFLDDHPNEVLTFIYEDHVDTATLAADLEASGLAALAFTHEPGSPWPTLGEMIDQGTRLVVTAESGGPPPPWLHHVWDVAFDTPYTFLAEAEFSCDLNRGERTNDLFLLNHWLSASPPLNLPTEDGARTVNARAVLQARAERCATEAGHLPNFVAVDFYEVGDLFAVVDGLNCL